MPRKSTKPKEVHTHLALKLTDYSISAGAGINPMLSVINWRHEETPVYSFSTSIDFVAIATWPEDRSQHKFDLSISGDYPHDKRFNQVLEDRHKRDDDGALEYRKKRGQCVPVYDLPRGIGFIKKARGEQRWCGAAWAMPHTITDMLVLLSGKWPLYSA